MKKSVKFKKLYWFLRKRVPFLFLFRFATGKYRKWYFKRTFLVEKNLEGLKGGEFTTEFVNHRGRNSQKWSHFLPIYDEVILEIKKKFCTPISILEIGVQKGGSLEIWRSIFGEQAKIFGVDIDPNCATLGLDAEIRIGSSANKEFLKRVANELGTVNLIIDDGSHDSKQQRIALEVLFPYLSENGLYIIEDLEHSYYWSKHGGYLRNGSIIERGKRLVDDLNKDYFLTPRLRSFKVDTQDVQSITFYQGLLIIRKSQRTKPSIVIAGLT